VKAPELPPDETQRLRALHSLRVLDTPAEERFDQITRMAKRLFNVPIALVSLVDSNRQWFKSRQGLDALETPRDISFCGHTILDEAVFIIENAIEDQRFADNPLVCGAPNIRFLGHMSPAELRALYRGATAVVIASLTFEIAPQVGIEAFHQRTPIIARDLGSLPEMAEGRGLLFHDERSLETALERLATDGALRDSLGHNAEQAAREIWSAESHFARYFALIEEVRTARAAAASAGRPGYRRR